MSEGGYFPRQNGNRLATLLGLLAIAFWAGDFVGQWRIMATVESELSVLRSEVAVLNAKVAFHDNRDGHSKVIERLTGLESDVEHLKRPWSFRPPLGDIE